MTSQPSHHSGSVHPFSQCSKKNPKSTQSTSQSGSKSPPYSAFSLGRVSRHRTSTPYNLYAYDTLDRLNKADYLDSKDEVFTYDDLGNRLTVNTRGDQNVAYSHNTANEYTSIGGQSVSHDAAGNLVMDQRGYQYEYDHDNRLTKITQDSTDIAAFTYDALGRRIEKIEYDTTNITTRYYYAGWRVLSETNAAGEIQRDYVYGNYLDEVLIKRQDTADLYYAHNHLYSPVALMEDDGTVVERYEYDAYGKPTIYNDDFSQTYDTSQHDNPVMFTGQRLDSLDSDDLLLMYYKNRYYNPTSGRFLHRDPIGYVYGMNLYEYAIGNPLKYFDPIGYNSEEPDLFEDFNEVGLVVDYVIGIAYASVKAISIIPDDAWLIYLDYSDIPDIIRNVYFDWIFYYKPFRVGRFCWVTGKYIPQKIKIGEVEALPGTGSRPDKWAPRLWEAFKKWPIKPPSAKILEWFAKMARGYTTLDERVWIWDLNAEVGGVCIWACKSCNTSESCDKCKDWVPVRAMAWMGEAEFGLHRVAEKKYNPENLIDALKDIIENIK